MYIWQHIWPSDKKTLKKREECVKNGAVEVWNEPCCECPLIFLPPTLPRTCGSAELGHLSYRHFSDPSNGIWPPWLCRRLWQ